MSERMHLATLAGVEPGAGVRACYAALDRAAPDDYRQLAALLVDDWLRREVGLVGLGGGQGAGKSTLGRLIAAAGGHFGKRVIVLSIDDFYLTKEERGRLASEVHPLLATRGPPGTHAVDLLRGTIAALRESGPVDVPRFDKGVDTRMGYETLHGPADLVVLEGWCVGASAATGAFAATGASAATGSLERPVNALEREEDPDGRWRAYVEASLQGLYAGLDEDLEALVFLKVPGLDAVRRWRLQQEGERPPEQRLTAAEVDRFVQHYERITRRMLAVLPSRTDVAVVELDDEHRVSGLRFPTP